MKVISHVARKARYTAKGVARSVLKRDQIWTVGKATISLPYDHLLPIFQAAHPAYDRSFLSILEAIAADRPEFTFVDVGANVGDTAAATLSVCKNARAIAIEGNPDYQKYLCRNLEPFSSRATILDAFVGTKPKGAAYNAASGTGGFREQTTPLLTSEPELAWIEAESILNRAQAEVIWKSDTDGMDVEILDGAWHAIDRRCGAIWFEYAPFLSVSSERTNSSLIRCLAESGREIAIFDNFGWHMLTVSGESVVAVLSDLTRWLSCQRTSHVAIPYLDIWAIRPDWYTPTVRHAIHGDDRHSRAEFV